MLFKFSYLLILLSLIGCLGFDGIAHLSLQHLKSKESKPGPLPAVEKENWLTRFKSLGLNSVSKRRRLTANSPSPIELTRVSESTLEDANTQRPEDSLDKLVHGDHKSTPFASFFSGIVTSLTLTLFTEFGDRTFFIAAILSLRHPKLLVLIATSLALVVQTVFSTLVGQLFHFLPSYKISNAIFKIPLDDYAAAVMLFVFGVIHLRAACLTEEPDSNLESDLAPYHSLPAKSPEPEQPITQTQSRIGRLSISLDKGRKNSELIQAVKTTEAMKDLETTTTTLSAFKQIFWAIFIAELGDKSMLSTVALAAAQNPYGVFVGSSLAHCLVTLVAVAAGTILEGYISEKIANLIGAALFFTFAFMTLVEGLTRQGFRMWWSFSEKASAAIFTYLAAGRVPSVQSESGPSIVDRVARMLSSY